MGVALLVEAVPAGSGVCAGGGAAPREQAVTNVAFSADGAWLATGADDGWVALCNLTEKTWRTLQERSGGKSIATFAPSGGLLAVTRWEGGEGSIVLWDVASGREVRSISFPGWTHALRFTPEGRSLVGLVGRRELDGLSDGQYIGIWELGGSSATWTRRAELRNAPGSGFREGALGMDRSGTRVAFGDERGYVHLYRVPELKEELVFKAHGEGISAVALSGDGRVVSTGSRTSDCLVRIWDAQNGRPLLEPLAGHRRYIHALALSPNGDVLASGSSDRSIRLWDVQSGGECRGTSRSSPGGFLGGVFAGWKDAGEWVQGWDGLPVGSVSAAKAGAGDCRGWQGADVPFHAGWAVAGGA